MADDVSQRIEDALNLIVNLTDKSGNIKKELKKSVHEAVSNLRNLIFALKSNLLEKTEENKRTQNEVNLLKDALQKWGVYVYDKTSSAICCKQTRTNQPWH